MNDILNAAPELPEAGPAGEDRGNGTPGTICPKCKANIDDKFKCTNSCTVGIKRRLYGKCAPLTAALIAH